MVPGRSNETDSAPKPGGGIRRNTQKPHFLSIMFSEVGYTLSVMPWWGFECVCIISSAERINFLAITRGFALIRPTCPIAFSRI